MDSATRKELLLRLITSAEQTSEKYRIERYFLIAISFLGALVLIVGSALMLKDSPDKVLELLAVGSGAGITSGASFMLSRRIDQHFELVGKIVDRLMTDGGGDEE